MPATESMLHSHGCPTSYPLKTGGYVEVRQGCLINDRDRKLICSASDAAQFVLDNCKLTDEQRIQIEEFGSGMFTDVGHAPLSKQDHYRNKYG